MKTEKLFEPGKLMATPGIVKLCDADDFISMCIGYTYEEKYLKGNWGIICKEDAEENRRALQTNERIMGVYEIENFKIWIITEADRLSTTILLPEEY